ncbi:MAG: diaminopimelate epimerase [Candidatus Omnitrophota bacterium]|jgi:diaminopimelate epimerase
MKKITFSKMVAAGNDFVVVKQELSGNLAKLAQVLCERKFGIGADGLLILGKSKKADLRMRIFNSDGSEAEMCGNGARCVALYAAKLLKKRFLNIETKAGVIKAQVKGDIVKVKLTQPKNIKLNLPIKLSGRNLSLNSINTGVPQAVIFSAGLDKINVKEIGRLIRYHRTFFPKGTNVNFVEVTGNNSIKVRTYERGVEDETLACGTGSTASALIFALKSGAKNKVNVSTRSGEVLKIYFKNDLGGLSDIWLEGKVSIVYKGECDV